MNLTYITSTDRLYSNIWQNEDSKPKTEKESSNSENIYEIVSQGLYLIFRLIFGVFVRIFSLPHLLVNTFSPNTLTNNEHKITQEKIDKKLFDANFKKAEIAIPDEKRFQYILTRTNELAKKMEIKKEIEVYINPTASKLESGGCNYTCADKLPLTLTMEECNYDQDQLDFVISQELSQISNNHKFYESLYEIAATVVMIAVGFFFSFWAIPILEGVFCAVQIIISRKMEQTADEKAVAHVGTAGAIMHMEHFLDKTKKKSDGVESSDKLPFVDGLVQTVIPLITPKNSNQRNKLHSVPHSQRLQTFHNLTGNQGKNDK